MPICASQLDLQIFEVGDEFDLAVDFVCLMPHFVPAPVFEPEPAVSVTLEVVVSVEVVVFVGAAEFVDLVEVVVLEAEPVLLELVVEYFGELNCPCHIRPLTE